MANYGPWAKFSLLLVFVKRHTYWFVCIVYGSFRATTELRSCNRDHMTHKAENISFWPFLEKVCNPLWLTHTKHCLPQASTVRTIDIYLFTVFCSFANIHWAPTICPTLLGCLNDWKRQKFLSSWCLLSYRERQTINNKIKVTLFAKCWGK